MCAGVYRVYRGAGGILVARTKATHSQHEQRSIEIVLPLPANRRLQQRKCAGRCKQPCCQPKRACQLSIPSIHHTRPAQSVIHTSSAARGGQASAAHAGPSSATSNCPGCHPSGLYNTASTCLQAQPDSAASQASCEGTHSMKAHKSSAHTHTRTFDVQHTTNARSTACCGTHTHVLAWLDCQWESTLSAPTHS